jgi:YHS domain-containing protein
MVATLFRLVVYVFIAYVTFLFIRITLGLKRAGRRPRQSPGRIQGEMVKDEVCGTYIPREEALTGVRDGTEHYFCSEECRRKFLQS